MSKMRAIIPNRLLRTAWKENADYAILKAMERTTRETVKDLRNIAAAWKRKPVVKTEERIYSSLIYTENAVMHFLDVGTSRHWIQPKKKRRGGKVALAFNAYYKAKSTPNSLTSYPGGGYGPIVFSKGHWVSGISPRHYSINLAYIAARKLRANIEADTKKFFK